MNPRSTLQILCLLAFSFAFLVHGTKVFNVLRYNAIPNNKTENSEAFMKAWVDTCKCRGKSRLVIPRGTYYLRSIVFKGPCNGNGTEVLIKGVLRAPSKTDFFFTGHWITFQYVNKLKIHGGGTLDGQGAVAWPYNNCDTGSCKPLPIKTCPIYDELQNGQIEQKAYNQTLLESLRLDFINDSEVSNINFINSKNFHFNVFACHRLCINQVTISAPQESPNTDGIHVSNSAHVKIDGAVIATGDDCISIGPGNHGIHISHVTCGPGHGISVGSLGKSDEKEGVSVVSVANCIFKGTMNGVQIKTWPDSKAAGGFASHFVYENITMEDVENPVYINQHYCPHNLCDPQGSSNIKISNITFRNIWGTSTTRDAVKLVCSETNPCHDIALENINLIGPGGSVSSSCYNVRGKSLGRVHPPSCLH